MSCCPPAPTITRGDSGDSNYYLQESDIIPGESVDCYMKRAGDSTGRMDDKTEDLADKIANTDVPLKADASVNVTFKLTPSSTRTATSWILKDGTGTAITGFTGVTFTNGVLAGTFADEYLNKSLTIQVTARDSAGDIDTRSFTFSPSKSTPMESIQFVHPLPGARVTSVFGPRKPPAVGASSQHGGVDFAYADRSLGDVICAADGDVVFKGYQAGGAGNYVKVKHVNGAGKHMCTTVYMHMDKVYVETGQKLVAGQKIGLEGSTGIGSGPHLHFECRMPNNSKVDPLPLIKGSIAVAQKTNPDNTAVESSVETQTTNAVLTPSNVDAKQGNCEPYGATYPKDPAVPTTPLPAMSTTDPFEKAWFFTMKHEVGPHWTEAFPNDPDVIAGAIDTAEQRKKCGYVNKERFPGGETKFGIAQGPNPSVNVRNITYAEAKKMGYNNYWKRGPEAMAATQPKTAIIMFDINYLHGVGNGNKIRARAGINTTMDDTEAADRLSAAQAAFMEEITAANPARNGPYIKGWLTRSAEINSYAKAA